MEVILISELDSITLSAFDGVPLTLAGPRILRFYLIWHCCLKNAFLHLHQTWKMGA